MLAKSVGTACVEDRHCNFWQTVLSAWQIELMWIEDMLSTSYASCVFACASAKCHLKQTKHLQFVPSALFHAWSR